MALSALAVGPGLSFAGYENLAVGPLWFLPALFFCRAFFGLLSKVRNGTWIAAMLGFLVSLLPDGIWLPFGIQQGIAGMFFYAAGHGFANARMLGGFHFALPTCALFALSAVWIPSMDMHTGLYPVPVLSVFAPLGACVLLWRAVYCLEGRQWKVLSAVSYCGRISLVILVVHYLEVMTFDWYARLAFMPFWAVSVLRVVVDFAVALVVTRIPAVRRLFCIK